ncbi:glycoside hydrolase family 16 protein [Dactylosporangium sp. AC04546]|uniref:glycoside hydrolase family 16 protein n=1 Tax=Dactylosporangium sp. AC04546 TaxID=2862460 RepID=UPI001EDCC14B|nr:glycoside hydrolase family 16 protein [Dactylosporangium sp. AC04546]WVK85774.1 glycoside hydrolase family 16 protein [Dactylosporangium sp. AC04546]
MRRLLIPLVVTSLAVVAPALPAAADPSGTGWTQVFSDDFSGSTLDTSRWNYRTDSKAYSTQRPENVSVSDGMLNIALKKETYGGKSYTGGGVISKQSLRYGYYETRAKLNDGAGWHSSFWIMSGDGSTTFPASQRTEIDGFEIDSISPTRIHHGVLTWKGSGVSAGKSYGTTYTSPTIDSRAWHVYGMDWQETSVRFYVDGTLMYTAPYVPTDWTHDYTNIWLTSIAYGTVPDDTKLPATVQFDYVRYWQRDYYVDNDGPAAYGYSETGTWLPSTLTGWTVASPTRYATCGSAGNTATWRPNLRAAGTYQVYYYRLAATNSDPQTSLTVTHATGTTTTVVNGTTSPSAWVSLGTYTFAQGTAGAVKLTSSGTGCARADAVKFVRA